MRAGWGLLAAIVSLTCASCASSGSASERPRSPASSTASHRPAFKDEGRLTAPVTYASGTILKPPLAADRAAITPLDAYNAVCSNAVCAAQNPPSVVLARVTDLDFGTAEDDGSIKPTMDRRLVYVLRFDGQTCLPAGQLPGRPAPTPVACSTIDFIDAGSGKFIYAES